MTARGATISSPRLSVEVLLGGKNVLSGKPRSTLDWVSHIRKGISSKALTSLTQVIGVSQSELATALGIPERTLARRKREGVLSSEESSKVVRLARVIERAEIVFEDIAAAIDWLKSSNAALGGVTPLSLLDTDIGTENVMDTLGRIEHGVFA